MSSAVANASTPTAAPKNGKVSPEILQDILYDLLTNGIDPCDTRVNAEQIEHFLFEHARSPKSAEAFVEFFNQHGLSINPEDHIKPLELRALNAGAGRPASLPPALPVRDKRPVVRDAALDLPMPQPLIAPKADGLPGLPASLQKSIRRRFASPTLWAAAASLALALGAVAALIYSIVALKAELNQTRAAQRQSRQAVVELQQRLDAVQSDMARNGQYIERMEPRIDLLVETLVAPTEPRPDQPAR